MCSLAKRHTHKFWKFHRQSFLLCQSQGKKIWFSCFVIDDGKPWKLKLFCIDSLLRNFVFYFLLKMNVKASATLKTTLLGLKSNCLIIRMIDWLMCFSKNLVSLSALECWQFCKALRIKINLRKLALIFFKRTALFGIWTNFLILLTAFIMHKLLNKWHQSKEWHHKKEKKIKTNWIPNSNTCLD